MDVERKAEAPRRRRLRGDQRQCIGPACEIGERQCVRCAGIGMVEPLGDAPRPRFATDDRLRAFGLFIERLDFDAVIGPPHELPLEIRAFQHPFDATQPRIVGGGRKVVGEGEVCHRALGVGEGANGEWRVEWRTEDSSRRTPTTIRHSPFATRLRQTATIPGSTRRSGPSRPRRPFRGRRSGVRARGAASGPWKRPRSSTGRRAP